MASIDPTTGQPLPADAIQRVLFVAPKVHVYQIPPLTSTKGYTAATWTEDPKRHIFTARLRVLETGIETDDDNGSSENVKVDVILEDPSSGQLFAAAPYTSAAVVEAALDSARFFALRVQDGQGRKATLGIGFEERPESFDFGVALQEARKTAGLDDEGGGSGSGGGGKKSASAAALAAQKKKEEEAAAKHDYSLKEGETITVNLSGSKFGRRGQHSNTGSSPSSNSGSSGSSGLSGFSLPPPPPPASSSSSSFALPPPPSNPRTANRQSIHGASTLGSKSAADLGFDDGQFGEFA